MRMLTTRDCVHQILDNFLKKNVGPRQLREARSAINRARTLSGDSGGLGSSPTREIRMTTVSTRRDDEQLLLSATPPDVEQDAVALAMAARSGAGSPPSHHRGSFKTPSGN